MGIVSFLLDTSLLTVKYGLLIIHSFRFSCRPIANYIDCYNDPQCNFITVVILAPDEACYSLLDQPWLIAQKERQTGKRPTFVCKRLSMWFTMKRTWKMKDDYVLFIHYLQLNVAVVIVHFGWDLFVAGVHVLVLVLIHLYGIGIKNTLNALYCHVNILHHFMFSWKMRNFHQLTWQHSNA